MESVKNLRAALFRTGYEVAVTTGYWFLLAGIGYVLHWFISNILSHALFNEDQLVLLLSYVVAPIGIALTVLTVVPKKEREKVLKLPAGWSKELVLGFLSGIAIVLTLAMVVSFLSRFLPSLNDDTANELPRAYMAVNSYISFVSLGFLSPIAEELYFRGVLLNRFKLINQVWFGVIFSTLLFALGHSGNLLLYLPIGFVLAGLAIKRQNIFFGIGVHIFNNIFVFLLFFSS